MKDIDRKRTAAAAALDNQPAAVKSRLAQVFAQYPIEVARGEGVFLYARDGRKILDLYGGHAVAGLGYGHPRWLAALERQARQMTFQTNALAVAVRERAAEDPTVSVGKRSARAIRVAARACCSLAKPAFKSWLASPAFFSSASSCGSWKTLHHSPRF